MSLPPSSSPPVVPPAKPDVRDLDEFTCGEQALLLKLAHESILSALDQCAIPLEPTTQHLGEFRGVFTSLYLRGELRGCVGYVFPVNSLYRAVAETARAAAFDDPRFSPVTKAEAPHLEIELSILSRPQPVRAEDVQIGRHGLLISQHGRRGLLLPQVPIEHQWNRETFLRQTSRKAGLPEDAWQKGAAIECFTAEIFSDKKAIFQDIEPARS